MTVSEKSNLATSMLLGQKFESTLLIQFPNGVSWCKQCEEAKTCAVNP